MRRALPILWTLMLSPAALLHGQVERNTRVFDLRFLHVDSGVSGILPPAPKLRGTVSPSWEDGSLENDSGAPEAFAHSPESLVDLVQDLIDPESWRNSRNEIEASGSALVVTQTPGVLARIEGFLSALEARAARTYSVDLALVAPAALEKASPGALGPGATPWLDGDALDRAVAADSGHAAVLSTVTRGGVVATLQPAAAGLLMRDIEVNQTGVIPVMNTVVGAVFEGGHAAVSVFALPIDDWVRADVALGHLGLRGKPERRRLLSSDIDLPATEAEATGASIALPLGRTALLGYFRAEEPAKALGIGAAPSFAALLRVRRLGEGGAAAGKELPAILEVAALTARPRDFSIRVTDPEGRLRSEDMPLDWVAGAAGAGSPEPDIALDPEEVLARISSLLKREDGRGVKFAGGALFLDGTEAEAAAARASLAALARERLRVVTIDLWQGIVENGEISGEAGSAVFLDPAWLDRRTARPGLRARIASVRGARASIASVLARSYVAHLDMVSGGTGTSRTVVVADPRIEITGTGLVLNASADLVPGSPLAQLRIDGEHARPPVFGRTAQVRSTLEVKAAGKGATAPVEPVGDLVQLDLPDEESEEWQHWIAAPLGRPILLGALPEPAAPGKARALVAVVHEIPLP